MRRFSCLDVTTAAGLDPPLRSGQELLFHCPNHEDKHPSLAINESKDVWICGPCGAGGNPWSFAAFCAGVQADDKKEVINWLRGVGLFENRMGGSEAVANYTYTDQHGEPLYRISRFYNDKTGKKTFAQYRPDGNGGWTPRITDDQGKLLVTLVPYRFDEIHDKPMVFIVEGEADVDELREWGLFATCNSGGAGSWKDEYAEHFAGKRICLIGDNDAAGRAHICQVGRSLFSVATLRNLLLPGLKDKDDFRDWKKAGGTLEQLREIVGSTPDLTLEDLKKLEEAVQLERKKPTNGNGQKPLPTGKADLLQYGLHDSGNAARLIALYGQDLRYSYKFIRWLVWDGRRWVKDEEVGIATKLAKEAMIEFYRHAITKENEKLETYAKGSLNKNRITGLLFMAQCELPIKVEKLDTDPYLLNCLNGTLDLKTGKLHKHRRDEYLTKLVHFIYDPEAECPIFLKFINEIMGVTPEASERDLERADRLVDYLQKIFGYALTGDVSEKAIFCFFGGGNNGKTTLLNAVSSVIPEYSSQVLIDTLMIKRQETNASLADLADLHGARFVVTSEGEEGQKLAEAKVKLLSSGMGKIKTARKYENFIQFTATHKLFMDSNYKPVVTGIDNAIWNRLKAIPFTVTIPKNLIDEQLPEKLKAEAEGILAWMVKGCLRWKEEGLGEPPEVEETSKGWREEMDPLKDFIVDCCWLGDEFFCKSAALWSAYKQWAGDNGERYFGRRKFNNRLKVLGCEPSRKGGPRSWSGIGLKDQPEEPVQTEFEEDMKEKR